MASSLRWKIAQWAEIRWWKRYLKNKDQATYTQWKKDYWENLLAQLGENLKLSNDDVVLDAGCGPSGIYTILEDQEVVAIDPLLNEYKHLFNINDYPNTQFIEKSLEDYQGSNVYNIVFCMNVINHVQDIQKSTDNLIESLKPKGQLLLTIDAHNYSFFKHIFRLLPGDILHPHQYDLQEYEEMLTKRGMKIVKTVHIKKAFFFDHYLLLAEK